MQSEIGDKYVENKAVNSNKNYNKGGNTNKFLSDTLNRLMAELSAMDEYDEFLIKTEAEEIGENYLMSGQVKTEVFVKEELNDDIYYDEDQVLDNVKVEDEVIGPINNFLVEVTCKEEQEEFTCGSDALACVTEDVTMPGVKFKTEVSIKQEEEELNQQYFYCLEDASNKYLKIMLRKLKCFMCEHCPAFYKKKKDLLNHIHIVHYLLFRNLHKVTKALHYCSICDKKMSYKGWHSHMNIVHSKQQCRCKICDRVFKHETYLKRHVKHVHGDVKPSWRCHSRPNTAKQSCVVCSKEFNNKHALRIHTKNCHSDEAYTCELCNSTLKCKSYLYTHMRRVHYDDCKVYSCDLCLKQFKSPRYLRVHKKNIHHLK